MGVIAKAVFIISYVITLAVNWAAAWTMFIGGISTAEVSNKYPTLITPEGYVFAIWGVIYFLLGIFVIMAIVDSKSRHIITGRVAVLFPTVNLLNVLWIFLWHNYLLDLTLVVIYLLFISLLILYRSIDVRLFKISFRDWLVYQLPFSTYLAWIVVALTANTAVYLVSVSWDMLGLSDEVWAVFIVALTTIIASAAGLSERDPMFPLVLLWALTGVKPGGQYGTLNMTLFIAIIVLAVTSTIALIRLIKKLRKS
ncbi:MAG: tryptophan-rich sensory protein [Sulfolobales archaeon]|nr:tryptophan-rich sensory protein [Sulfolobales archaeon]MCX8186820.1 tryptophan-rich sensory protein [Sulfolobales archaeon]MDW7969836.1 tryptophan-rich sensory protein [Sulfolobales archaeon]